MQTLTKREKILLYILLCVLILIGGIFLLNMPALDKYNELSAQYDVTKVQLNIERGNIVEYGDLDAKIAEVTKEYNATVDKFYSTKMLNEDVDKLITTMAIEHGLTPSSLMIGEISEEELLSYQDYVAKQKKAENNKNNTKKNDDFIMKAYNVSLKVTGNISNLQSLVNDANQSKSLKVESVSYEEQSEEQKEMTVTFKIFLI